MTENSVPIRAMTAADVDRVIQIAAALPSAPHWGRQAWADALKPDAVPRRIAVVAVAQPGSAAARERLQNSSEIFGFAVASLLPPEGELEGIAVSHEWQRLGLGRALLAGLLEQVRQAGVTALALEVRSANLTAIGLYRAFGFTQVGSRVGYYADPVEDAVLMRLNLG